MTFFNLKKFPAPPKDSIYVSITILIISLLQTTIFDNRKVLYAGADLPVALPKLS